MQLTQNKHLPDLCCCTGGAFLLLTAVRCGALVRGGRLVTVCITISLFILAGLALLLLRLEGASAKQLKIMLLPIGAAMLARAMCLDHAGADYRTFLLPWIIFYRGSGGLRALSANLGDYNVPYLYILALLSYIDVQPIFPIKLVSVLADVMLAWGGFRLVRVVQGHQKGSFAPFAAFALLLLLPTVIINSAYWAQCDAIYGALILHALASVLEGKNYSSAALLGVAFCFKLQAVFLLPLWGVLLLAKRVRFRELFAFPAAYFIVILPALLLGKPLKDILSIYFHQMGEYSDQISMNSPSIFALLPTNVSYERSLAPLLGIATACLLVLTLMGIGFFMRDRLDDHLVMGIAVVMVIGVPFFLPHMHERYFFLADVLTICWACVSWKRALAAVLSVSASLYCYSLFLFDCSSLLITLFGYQFSKWLGALFMLVALFFSTAVLARDLKTCKEQAPKRIST